MREAKRTSGIFIGPDGNKHHPSKDAILIDFSTGKSLSSLLDEAFTLEEKIRKEQKR